VTEFKNKEIRSMNAFENVKIKNISMLEIAAR
jgi:hypothetical protein